MADAAVAATSTHEVYFVTVSPVSGFFSAGGRETLLQLLEKKKSGVHIISIGVGYEFELGTQAYREYVYKSLIGKLPVGTPIILADDIALWESATWLHESFPVVGVLHADENYYYSLAEKFHGSVDMLACVSNRVSDTVKTRYPALTLPPVYTIPCGINLPSFDAHVQPSGILKLVYVGRISNYQKRTGDLVKICALLKEKAVEFHLDIIGDGGADKAALENLVIEQGLADQITFCGWLSQEAVAQCLSQSDILLLTSDFEGTPIAMMEALAAGCGLVGTRVSGIEDYEHHLLAADCISLYEVGIIEHAVSNVIKLSGIAVSTRRSAARKIAESEFSLQVCLEKYFHAIDALPAKTAEIRSSTLSPFEFLYSRSIALARYLKVRLTGNKHRQP
jgi:glycosyltransferase involved in cell wall biosynthesis